MNEDLPEAIEFENRLRKHNRTWNYVMSVLAIIAIAGIVTAIVWAH